MTELEALNERHSVRKYYKRQLEPDMIQRLQSEIADINRVGNLNMQLIVNESKAFKSMLAYGMFSNVNNYILVAGEKSETLDYRAGYYSEKLMLYAQRLGLNTCCVGLTYKKIEGTYRLEPSEKIVVCIAIGYGVENSFAKHKIKQPEQVSNIDGQSPDWFRRGVEAALKAPTAVNQQKFYFEYIPENKVRPSRRKSLVGYTKIDLGIAMYNFEIGAGRQNFEWLLPEKQQKEHGHSVHTPL